MAFCFYAPATLFNMLSSSSVVLEKKEVPSCEVCDWKHFPRCDYRFSIRWFWAREDGVASTYFCIKNSNRIRILHNILPLCTDNRLDKKEKEENFEGEFIVAAVNSICMSVRRHEFINFYVLTMVHTHSSSQCLGTILMIIFKVTASHLHII